MDYSACYYKKMQTLLSYLIQFGFEVNFGTKKNCNILWEVAVL